MSGEHHELTAVLVEPRDDGPRSAEQRRGLSKKAILIICGLCVLVVGLALGLGLGIGLNSGGDPLKDADWSEIAVVSEYSNFTMDPKLQLDIFKSLEQALPDVPADVDAAIDQLINDAMNDTAYKDHLAAMMNEYVVNATNGALTPGTSRKLLDLAVEEDSPMVKAAFGFMLSAGEEFNAALQEAGGNSIQMSRYLPAISVSNLPMVSSVKNFVDKYDEAGAPLRLEMCVKSVGQPFYGNMAVPCNQITISPCNNGNMTIETSSCGARWTEVLSTVTESCRAKDGVTPTGASYENVCMHQSEDGREGIQWDDGPSCPWAVLYFGRKLLSYFLHLDPIVNPVTVGKGYKDDILDLWMYLFNKEKYVAKQRELEDAKHSFELVKHPALFQNFNYIFWAAGVDHDNCYHHGNYIGKTKADCDNDFYSTMFDICKAIFNPNNRYAISQYVRDCYQRKLARDKFPNSPGANTFFMCNSAARIFYYTVWLHGEQFWLAVNSDVGYKAPSKVPPFRTHRREGCQVTLPHCTACYTDYLRPEADAKFELGRFDLDCEECEEGFEMTIDETTATTTCVLLPPVISITPESLPDGRVNTEYTFEISVTDISKYVSGVDFVVQFGDGESTTLSNVAVSDKAAEATVTHAYQSPGNYDLVVSVLYSSSTDGQVYDLQAIQHAPVTIKEVVAPVLDIAATLLDAATNTYQFEFKVSGLPAGISGVEFDCNYGDSSPIDAHKTTEPPTDGTAAYTSTHSYTILSEDTTVSVDVLDLGTNELLVEGDYVISAGQLILEIDPPGLANGLVNYTYTFNLNAKNFPPEVTTATFKWNFGDGAADATGNAPATVANSLATASITHKYTSNGSFALSAAVEYGSPPSNGLAEANQVVTIGASSARPANLTACDYWQAADEGSDGATVDTWDIASIPDGATFDLEFDCWDIPDRISVVYNGKEVLNTGWRGGESYLGDPKYPGGVVTPGYDTRLGLFSKIAGGPQSFTVTVMGGGPGTAWDYSVRCNTPGVVPTG